jgi:hypothetical protein
MSLAGDCCRTGSPSPSLHLPLLVLLPLRLLLTTLQRTLLEHHRSIRLQKVYRHDYIRSNNSHAWLSLSAAMSKQSPAPVLKMDLLSSAIAGDASTHHVQTTAVFDLTGAHTQEALLAASSPATGCLPCSPLVCPASLSCPSNRNQLTAFRRSADWHVGGPNVSVAYL